MTKKKYKVITETVEIFSLLDLEVTVDEVIAQLDNIKTNHPQHTNFQCVLDGGYDGFYSLEIQAQRKETDKEREKRLTKARKCRETKKRKKEERKQQLLKELKKLGADAPDDS